MYNISAILQAASFVENSARGLVAKSPLEAPYFDRAPFRLAKPAFFRVSAIIVPEEGWFGQSKYSTCLRCIGSYSKCLPSFSGKSILDTAMKMKTFPRLTGMVI